MEVPFVKFGDEDSSGELEIEDKSEEEELEGSLSPRVAVRGWY